MRALIVTDLEGVHGADSVECLLAQQPAWRHARLRATHEVNLAIVGLTKQGFSEFIVSDSHRNGLDEPNLVLAALDPRARYEARADAFAAPLFSGVDAVAALGMHVAGGKPGFVGHALDIGLAWELEGRLLSETDFLMDLCAEALTPFLFVTGERALVTGLQSGVRGVVTKQSSTAVRATSLPLEVVDDAIVRAALEPAQPCRPLPQGALRMHVKGDAFDLPAEPFLERESTHTVLVHGDSARSRYEHALIAVQAAASALEQFLDVPFGSSSFILQIEALLMAPWPSIRPKEPA